MTSPTRSAPPRKLRIVGAVCLVAGVLAVVGAASGWKDGSGTPTAVLWVVGIVLIVVSAPCLVTARPKVASAGADEAGVTITLRNGTNETVPWHEIAAVTFTGIGPPPHTAGRLLDLQAAGDSLGAHRRAGRWAAPRANNAGHLIVAVPAHAASELDAQLKRCAGVRYRPS